MKYYYVYILGCADKSFYVGITNNLQRRLDEHSFGINKGSYPYDKRPVELIYHEEFTDVWEAISREKQLKGWSRKKKEALISARMDKLKLFSVRHRKLKKILGLR